MQVRFLPKAQFMPELQSPLSALHRVGNTTLKYLKKLGLETIQDLLFYLPFRYEDLRSIRPINTLKPGETAVIVGTIEIISNKRSFRSKKYITEALINDGQDTIKAIWFNQPFLARNLKTGDKVSLAGKVKEDYGQLSIISPVYEKITNQTPIHTQGFVPNYPLTAGLSQKQLRSLIHQVLPLAKDVTDWLPENIRQKLKLLSLNQAIYQAHSPKNEAAALAAKRRLNFDSLFLRQLKSKLLKNQLASRQAPIIEFKEAATKHFLASLPFKLTDDQRRAAWEILQDIGKDRPMSRLLEGDVGSGKTIVAALAIFNAALNGQKSALMAPTEILAKQHYRSLNNFFAGLNIKIGLLSRNFKESNFPLYQEESNKQKISIKDRAKLIIDQADLIIGTHALIQETINFQNLGLSIVDEQHRFGVVQRKKILLAGSSKSTPHFLSMTATPIPRSLALAIYGDLDISIIKELPSGRKKIITRLIPEKDRSANYRFIHQEIKAGRQAFVICPLIEESDKLGAKSAKLEHERLSRDVFPDLKIGLLHGKMKGEEKEAVMTDFLANKINILVTTSVIEVGVDVANASLMIIEGAERFGLAQLHQFRGRVGRGDQQSYCLLFLGHDAPNSLDKLQRLKALVKYSDGLSLANIDLKLRGGGEIYGASQSGWPEIDLANLFDTELIKTSGQEIDKLIDLDPTLEKHPQLKNKLGEWEASVHLE